MEAGEKGIQERDGQRKGSKTRQKMCAKEDLFAREEENRKKVFPQSMDLAVG